MPAHEPKVTAEMLANGARVKAILERRAAAVESAGSPTKEQAESLEKARGAIANIEAISAKAAEEGDQSGAGRGA